MLQVTEEARKRAEIDGLIERWQKHRDERAFNRLLEMHRHVIAEEARRYRWPGSEYEDRLAAGHEGFLLAANKATVGNATASFATYCRKFIRDVIIDAKRRSDAADPTKSRGEGEDGQWVSLRPTKSRGEGKDGEWDPLDKPVDGGLIDPTPSPEREAIARLDFQALMASLTDKERRAIKAQHVEGRTQAEAAERLGNDVRTVRRLLKQVRDA